MDEETRKAIADLAAAQKMTAEVVEKNGKILKYGLIATGAIVLGTAVYIGVNKYRGNDMLLATPLT